MSNNYTEEINRRRTFAIISHPDAGKTTLTEKFLLYGGWKFGRRGRENNGTACGSGNQFP